MARAKTKREQQEQTAKIFGYIVFLLIFLYLISPDTPEPTPKPQLQTAARDALISYYTPMRDGDLYFKDVLQPKHEVTAIFFLREEYFDYLDALPFKQQQSEGRELCPPVNHASRAQLGKGYGISLQLNRWTRSDQAVLISC